MSPLYLLLAAALVGTGRGQQVTCSGHLRCVDSAWCGDDGYLFRTSAGSSGKAYASGEHCLLSTGAWGRCCQPRPVDSGEVICWAHQTCVTAGYCDGNGYYSPAGDVPVASGNNANGYCLTSDGVRGTCCDRRPSSSGETGCWDHQSCVSSNYCDGWGYYWADGTSTSNWNDWWNGSWCSTSAGARGTCCSTSTWEDAKVSCWAHQTCNPGGGCPAGYQAAKGSHSTNSWAQYCLTSDEVPGTCCEPINYA